MLLFPVSNSGGGGGEKPGVIGRWLESHMAFQRLQEKSASVGMTKSTAKEKTGKCKFKVG